MYKFDAIQEKNNCVNWIKQWFSENGANSPAIIGISGGKDSAVVAALCCEALGKDRVVGVQMPCGKQTDIQDSDAVITHLGITNVVSANIGDTFKTLTESIYEYWTKSDDAPPDTNYTDVRTGLPMGHVSKNVKIQLMTWPPQAVINTPARLRMTVLYAIGAKYNGRVVGTGNLSEDYLGYFTKYGDGGVDLLPIANFTVTEVKSIGRVLGLPDKIIDKPPSDGLGSGKTDEENLGLTYKQIDEFLRNKGCRNSADVNEKIKNLHELAVHKLDPIPIYRENEICAILV